MNGSLSCVGSGEPEPRWGVGNTVIITVLVVLLGTALTWREMPAALVVEVMAAFGLAALQVPHAGRHRA